MACRTTLRKIYRREIVDKLQKMGCNVKSVNALNKIKEKRGLLVHYESGWGITDKCAKFSMWRKDVSNSSLWHSELVDEIIKYLNDNKKTQPHNRSKIQWWGCFSVLLMQLIEIFGYSLLQLGYQLLIRLR